MTEKRIYQQAHELIEGCQSFALSTIDRNGFPYTIIVGPPIQRKGISSFHFYINGDGRSASNITRNELGCVCCHYEAEHQSVAVRGKFKLIEIRDVEAVNQRLVDYQKELDYAFPVIAEFTALSLKVHRDLKTKQLNLSD